jgi:hypothetical protein
VPTPIEQLIHSPISVRIRRLICFPRSVIGVRVPVKSLVLQGFFSSPAFAGAAFQGALVKRL